MPVNEACGNTIVVTELNAQETVTFLSVHICVCCPIRAAIAQQGAVVLMVERNVLGKMGSCYVLYHHVTPEHITHLPVHISRPNTTGTHPAARGMSGPFRKDLDILHYFGTPSHAVGYSLCLGTTLDNTIC